MATYKVRDPQGNIREISGPEGASDADVIAQAQRLFGGESAPRQLLKQIDPGIRSAASDSSLENFGAGVGKAIVDTGRGLGQLVGLVDGEDVKESRRLDKDLMDTKAGLGGDIAGNVLMALLPGGAAKTAASVAKAVPSLSRAAPAISAAGDALLAPKSIPAALAVGGGMGAIQPVENAQERVINTLMGGAATGAIPAAGTALRTGKAALEPFYKGGQDQIIGRALSNASGGRVDDVINALTNARQIVPGSLPTAGQASGNAGVAALERAAEAAVPEATVPYAARKAAQNAARVDVVEDMAGKGGQREFFAANRDATANQLYETAYQKGIDIFRDPATGRMLPKNVVNGIKGEITKLTSRPAIQEAMQEARKLAANEGVNMKDFSGSVKGLDYVKRALDDKISATSGNEARILNDLKKRLLTTIDSLSPDYAAARKTFQDMSKPINQMDIAEEIAKKSITPDTRQLQSRAFARSLSDDTAARATGFNRATMAGVMEPDQLARLDAVKEDITRAMMAQNAGRGPGSDTVQKLAYTNILDRSGVPTMLRNFAPLQIGGNLASRGADAAYGRANKEIAEKLALVLLDPAEAARIMRSAKPSQRQEMIELLTSRALTPIGMSAPASLNAQQ